jgi:hypothetical protein
MTDRPGHIRTTSRVAALVMLAVFAGACSLNNLFGSPTPSLSPSPSQASPTEAATASPSESRLPTPTPEPPLSLGLPPTNDPRKVTVTWKASLPAGGSGQLQISVANRSDTPITELVLRWPTALKLNNFLSPFAPSQIRIREGGPALYQLWTKWVEGPGERGEPAGTTSLGWGPLDPGATITIPLIATRKAAGPVAFDLQVLAGEAIMQLDTGGPAELRVQLP